MSQIENDDFPVFVARITAIGPQPKAVFVLFRELLGLSPADAKETLSAVPVEVAQGCRMDIENTVERFQSVGATVVVSQVNQSP